MASFESLTIEQVDAKSPINELLMRGNFATETGGIKYNLDALKTSIDLAGGGPIDFKVNGNLNVLSLTIQPERGLELDTAHVANARKIQKAALYVDVVGVGGTFRFDVRAQKQINKPIKSIKEIYSANTQSISRIVSQIATQSITRAEVQFATQSIEYVHAEINIESIVKVNGLNKFRYNLEDFGTPLNEDYIVGKYIKTYGNVNAGNNGTYQIVEVNKDNGKNIVIENINGVEESVPTGKIRLLLAQYNFVSTVPAQYVEGELALFAGHTDASNNGSFEIYKKNVVSENIQVFKSVDIIEQAGVAGTVDTNRFSYNFLASVSSQYVVGEKGLFAAHSSANNNGLIEVKEINYNGGFNIIVYNTAGVVQAGVAGTVDNNRFVYALNTSPTGQFVAGDFALLVGHTNALNDGTFEVLIVSYLATPNIVIYNTAGVVQAGIAGTVDHTDKAIEFFEDISANFTPNKSSIKIFNTYNENNDGIFLVKENNRVAVSPYNVIVSLPSGITEDKADGIVLSEVKSIFTNGEGEVELVNDKSFFTFTLANNELIDENLANNSIIIFDILETPANVENVAINLS